MPLFTIEKSNIIIYGSDCVAKELLLVTVCAFVLTTFFVPIVKLLAVHIGAVDKPNARKVHHKIMPRMGGLAIYGAFLDGDLHLLSVFPVADGFFSSARPC